MIGPWTVDMFMIFSLKRADIMPVGDLGEPFSRPLHSLISLIIPQLDIEQAFKRVFSNGSPLNHSL